MALVQTLVGDNSDKIADDLAVGCEQEDGSFTEPLSGAALLARVEMVLSASKSSRARNLEAAAVPG